MEYTQPGIHGNEIPEKRLGHEDDDLLAVNLSENEEGVEEEGRVDHSTERKVHSVIHPVSKVACDASFHINANIHRAQAYARCKSLPPFPVEQTTTNQETPSAHVLLENVSYMT